jgi:hypothetical protein
MALFTSPATTAAMRPEPCSISTGTAARKGVAKERMVLTALSRMRLRMARLIRATAAPIPTAIATE